MLKNNIPKKSDKIASRTIDNEAVVVEPDKNVVNVLNAVGSRVWELIDGKRTISAIAEIIADEFEVTAEKAERDAEEFIRDLQKKGLIEF